MEENQIFSRDIRKLLADFARRGKSLGRCFYLCEALLRMLCFDESCFAVSESYFGRTFESFEKRDKEGFLDS